MSATPQVDFQHPLYKQHEAQIRYVQNIYNGIDTVRPMLMQKKNEYNTDFDNRVANSTLENFVDEIITTVSGEIMRKPLTFDGTPEATVEELKTVSGHDTIDQFAKLLSRKALRDGKAFILADLPREGGKASLNIVERLQLINWKKNSDGIYTMVVISEMYEAEEGEFGVKYNEQLRQIDAVGNVTIWRQSSENNKNVWYKYEEITTSYNFCPFYEVSLSEIPVFYDIATINFRHFNLDSLKSDYLVEALDPVLAFIGAGSGEDDLNENEEPSDSKVVLGVRSSFWLDSEEADVKWIEMSGNNHEIAQNELEYLKVAITKSFLKLQGDGLQTKSATQSQNEQKQSESFNSDVAEVLEVALNSALQGLYAIQNKTFVGECLVNRDFTSSSSGNDAIGINTIYMSGLISHKTALEALNKAEVIDLEDVDEEIRQAEIEGMGREDEEVAE